LKIGPLNTCPSQDAKSRDLVVRILPAWVRGLHREVFEVGVYGAVWGDSRIETRTV